MKGLFKRLSVLAASLAMVFGVGLVSEEENARAAEIEYKSLSFPDNKENNKVSAYDTSWTAKNGADSYTINNANNNSWNNKWTYIKMGSKKAASVGTITTDFAIDKAITKVVTTIDKVTASSINSTYLEVASDSGFKTIIEKVTVNIAQGNLAYTITNPAANLFYRLTFDCKKASSNGVVQISKVGYYAEIAERTLDNLTLSGTLNKSTYTVGETFSSEGLTITANYSDGSTEDVTSKVTWPELTIGMTSITGTYEDKTILVTGITVKEKPTDLVLSEIKITEGENVKKTYYVGDSVNTTGLTVTAGYLSESDPSHESYVDVTDKVTWSLDTSAINAEAHLTATYIEGEITETTYIVVAVVAAPTYVVDKLAANNLTATDSNYTDFKDVSSTSGIKYAGNSASDGSNIQLRSKNSHSGIVSTTAKRILTKVEVEWGTGNTSSRTIDIYGYNTAFNDATELYDTKAVKLGSIGTSSTSFEVPAGTKYAYVGVRSNSDAIYLASISFTWDISSEANSFIDMWSQMRADGTNGICDYLNGSQNSSELDTLLEMYNDSSLIDAADKAIINDAADGENNTIGNSILYIAAYKAAHTSNNAGMNNAYHAVTNNISFILIISVIGLSSVLGYYFIQKRRLAK